MFVAPLIYPVLCRPSKRSALRLPQTVVEDTVSGAVPVPCVDIKRVPCTVLEAVIALGNVTFLFRSYDSTLRRWPPGYPPNHSMAWRVKPFVLVLCVDSNVIRTVSRFLLP